MTWRNLIVVGIGLSIVTSIYFRNFLFRENLHPVIVHDVYRSAQPSPEGLTRAIESIGLRSVINLKNSNPGDRNLETVVQVDGMRKVDFRYVRLSARRLPSPSEVEQVIETLRYAARPVLIHCQNGTDRSGLASAIALLMDGRGVDEARKQFALAYGYPGETFGSDLPDFLDRYQAFLDADGLDHSPERFEAWVHVDYIAYYYEAQLEFILPQQELQAGVPFRLQVRVTNQSDQPIPMRCGEGEGVRVSVRLQALAPNPRKLGERRFCKDDRPLAPGEQIVVESDEYRLASAGRYEWTADLVDESKEHFFADMGSVTTKALIDIR